MSDTPPPPVRVILQARTTSSRLPAKVLLPLAGLPLSVLAARRVARDGLDVVVATSTEPEDDLLARTLSDAGLNVLRGPLHNVLARFVMATADLPDEAICLRLTSDNPGPDADFLRLLVDQFRNSGAHYLAYGNNGAWLPYGLSAEAFRVGDLRACAAGDLAGQDADYVREHVTPAIRAAHALRHRPPLPDWDHDMGHLRCTVDTLDDYLRMAALFQGYADPVSVPWRDLVATMGAPKPPAGLVLGTVQLGLPYGITREAGLMPADRAEAILTAAQGHGCAALDTARAYGDSEARIGSWLATGGRLPVITKLSPLDVAETPEALTDACHDSIAQSIASLGKPLETVLLHRASHLHEGNGAVWRTLLEMRAAGQIARLGASVQTPDELLEALSFDDLSHIQLPFNALDWRWDRCVAALRARPDVTVHARSLFLQGLLVQPDASRWPTIPGVDAPAVLATLAQAAQDLNRAGIADLCIAYARAFSWIDGLVMGVDSPEQLDELAALFAAPPLTWDEADHLQRSLPDLPEQLLNPALWGR